ncbi:MAG: (2Fe-2S)-binding protein [Bryobacteraceae bacterium]|nr:(2Fe-2S)-binding protein [Bryobacteraceae bacterium]
MDVTVDLNVNGRSTTVTTDPDRPLLDVLREDLGLTGTKYGCGEGQCRTCTVLVDGRPVTSCLMTVSRAAGRKIVTIEGLAREGGLHPVQEAFLSEGAMQCGYCVPGMILNAAALLETNPDPSDEQIVEWMNGNLCRCCGYPKIVAAVRRAAAAGALSRRGER